MKELDIVEIQKIIPHRYPFLLVDKALVSESRKEIVGYKAVTINEWFFQGHYPNYPIFPGVLILEALAQTFCILLLGEDNKKYYNKIPMLIGIESAEYRSQVKPGDLMRLNVKFLHEGSRAGRVQGSVYVDGRLIMEGVFKYVVVNQGGK